MHVWAERFKKHDVLYGIVPTTQEVAKDEQMAENGVFLDFTDEPLRTVSSPVHVEGIGKAQPSMPTSVGEHTAEILAELGYSKEAIDGMESKGVVMQGARRAD